MTLPNSHLIILPESAPEIIRIADRALRAAGARGKLPTPIEDLIRESKITDERDAEGVVKRFLSSLNEGRRAFFRSSMQKLRGIADLRERAVYVPADTAPPASASPKVTSSVTSCFTGTTSTPTWCRPSTKITNTH